MYLFFFFNDTATTEIYTLSLHDALPIYLRLIVQGQFTALERAAQFALDRVALQDAFVHRGVRSEEHTSELQSRLHLVCRLLLEKKKKHRFRHCPGYRAYWPTTVAYHPCQ